MTIDSRSVIKHWPRCALLQAIPRLTWIHSPSRSFETGSSRERESESWDESQAGSPGQSTAISGVSTPRHAPLAKVCAGVRGGCYGGALVQRHAWLRHFTAGVNNCVVERGRLRWTRELFNASCDNFKPAKLNSLAPTLQAHPIAPHSSIVQGSGSYVGINTRCLCCRVPLVSPPCQDCNGAFSTPDPWTCFSNSGYGFGVIQAVQVGM